MGNMGKGEFEASLVYETSSRTARAVTPRDPVSKINKNKKKFLSCW